MECIGPKDYSQCFARASMAWRPQWPTQMQFGAVVIGRNEGERLKRCLTSLSLSNKSLVVYVDSGSTDGSAQWARERGVAVVDLDIRRPFTAGRARNAGFRRLQL